MVAGVPRQMQSENRAENVNRICSCYGDVRSNAFSAALPVKSGYLPCAGLPARVSSPYAGNDGDHVYSKLCRTAAFRPSAILSIPVAGFAETRLAAWHGWQIPWIQGQQIALIIILVLLQIFLPQGLEMPTILITPRTTEVLLVVGVKYDIFHGLSVLAAISMR